MREGELVKDERKDVLVAEHGAFDGCSRCGNAIAQKGAGTSGGEAWEAGVPLNAKFRRNYTQTSRWTPLEGWPHPSSSHDKTVRPHLPMSAMRSAGGTIFEERCTCGERLMSIAAHICTHFHRWERRDLCHYAG